MSKFLAPIHFWLFNKIKISEDLEKDIVNTFDEKYNNKGSIIYKDIINIIGIPTEDTSLENIIDTTNIHGWLQNKISLTEKRTAALITELTKNFGEASLNIIKSIFENQGRKCGEEVREDGILNLPKDLFKALNNYILEGMPCDNVNSICKDDSSEIQWTSSKCLHKQYWDEVNGDITIFYSLRKAWIKSFIEAINPSFIYNQTIEQNDGNYTFINSFLKKNM
ncbi:hypothetical protein KQI89_01710 [Clostridium sp. MSJ-4]|uniref:Uncharacterized protein n=1 Tax=Clostridium simiarum TaxID=2841506 RepID=A0ABS6EWL5_9CLOT|nr:hypothetical protein [Clostridium simiarum]MBU5590471.1 hypothetical protein [Clostridium simiarum]